jgi:hypothetical protein
MNAQKNIEKSRFAACQRGARLVTISPRAAVRRTAAISRVFFSVDCLFRGGFSPASRSKKQRQFYALRNFSRENFAAHTLKQKTHLAERTHLRQQ